VGAKPNTDLSEFAEFADALLGQRADSEQVVRHALRRVGERYPERFPDEVRNISRAICSASQRIARRNLGVAGDSAAKRCSGQHQMRIRAVSASSAPASRALFWNIMEETDEDLF
jgi:hypothetical protein